MSEPLIVKNADSYDLDTREQLEADIRSEYYGGIESEADEIIGWLDRQAAITIRECTSEDGTMCRSCRAAQKRKIAELTAERDELTNAINELQKKQPYCYNPEQPLDTLNTIGRYIDELTAERNQLSRDLTAEHALVAQFEHNNEQLREAIDAMNNGQFYAMYKAKCEECEQLKKVARTQAESFKKLECELARKQ